MSNQPQCNAVTKSGKRCSRPKHHLSLGYCAQHEDTKQEGEQSLPPSETASERSVSAEPVTPRSPSVSHATTAGPATTKPSESNSLAAKLSAKFAPTAQPPHLIIEARAGSGKTTTLVEALRRLKGTPTPGFVPSPQQQSVFDSVDLSKDARTICFVAFNKSIASELKSRVPAGCEASTMHSMGMRAVRGAYRLNNSNAVNEDRVQNIISELVGGVDVRELRRREGMMVSATQKLVSLVKMNLSETDPESLDQLVNHYQIEFTKDGEASFEKKVRDKVYDLVPQVIERCKDVARDGFIDFDDMVWLPVALNLPMAKYDLLLVDEAQDLNRCQQALAKLAGKRLILCGDPKQAIYGFAGADSQSMTRMAKELSGPPDDEGKMRISHAVQTYCGCVVLPLTVTRRCGKAIVKEANKIVPDFYAHESNGEGLVRQAFLENEDQTSSYRSEARDGDMVLCRVNAPLVSECFRFLKQGRKASIQGREIGQGLVNLILRLGKNKDESHKTVPELVAAIDDWRSKEIANELAKRHPNDAKLIAVEDKTSCLQCFTEGCSTVSEVVRKVEAIFTDDKNRPGILLSSVHKAKGLEASRVYIIRTEKAQMPHPMAKGEWQVEQEYHILYVAITRAIKELVYVS